MEADIGLAARSAPSGARMISSPNRLMRMFSGVENCWRIEAADSVVEEQGIGRIASRPP